MTGAKKEVRRTCRHGQALRILSFKLRSSSGTLAASTDKEEDKSTVLSLICLD